MKKTNIPTPALLIDIEKVDKNIANMANFFSDKPASLRPHFKTHKCVRLAEKQIEAGAIGITCAKLGEAEILALAGISSILIANEIVDPNKIARLAEISLSTELIIAADNPNNLQTLSAAAIKAGSIINVLVEVNVGLDRCGVSPGKSALDLAHTAAKLSGLHFSGLIGYEGHTQFELDPAKRRQKTQQAMSKLTSTANLIRQSGLDVKIISAGGTGTFDITGTFPNVTEVEAGSYLFMDSEYEKVGVPFVPSIKLLATVISIPTPQRAIIDSGMKSISTDNGLPRILSRKGITLKALHEEHGILELDPSVVNLQVGDHVELLPSHVCTTVNLHDNYYVMRRDSVETIWSIQGRGKFQ